MSKRDLHGLSLIALALLISCCGWKGGWLTTVGPDYKMGPLPTASRWYSSLDNDGMPIAHGGDTSDLRRWWDRFNDPALSRLLAAAQKESASVAAAKAHIEQARASLIVSNASALPSLDVNAGITQSGINISNLNVGGQSLTIPPIDITMYKVGVQSSWEVDLFGGLARQSEASQSQLESSTASWHAARVAVAATVADAYVAYRACEVQVKLVAADAESLENSARLLGVIGDAGFRPQADVALIKASSADGKRNLQEQQTQCERSIKGLVAISGLREGEVRQLLTGTTERVAQLPDPLPFNIDAMPARVLLQRPDIAAAERDVAEASATIGVERAKQFPKLSLTGNVSRMLANLDLNVISVMGIGLQTWSVGPSLTLPLFDAGKRVANTRAAQAQYESALANFRAKVRTAAKEVEEALLRLDSAGKRLPQARLAADEYQKNFQAMQELYQVGLGSLIDAESARRSALSAQVIVAKLEQERVGAWIALYRAAGGSWEDSASAAKPKTDASRVQ